MSCARVAEEMLLGIDKEITGSDKVGLELSTERVVQSFENPGWVVRDRCLCGKRNLEHGSNERGGYTVTGNIGYEYADALFVDDEEVIEVAGDSSHGNVECSDVKPCETRKLTRENGRLNLPRDFKFLAN